ncbi:MULTISPECIES: type II secretion system protein N [Ramlibacter]|uniref:Type II secretion system protein N n=1 Tax=Ramlibacter aquaticus TaxID=2780094 RepID=A0ABR9SK47_9BURK|nr:MULTISPECIES: type II secretion system protein N [Ramlibacter]MBE7942715.1 type II secretion system protein N [Ramlibacter aquaticus]
MATARPSLAPHVPWGWAGAGAVLGLLLALLLGAPAHWLASALDQASGGRVQLADPRGTVWQGSGQLVFTGGSGSNDALALPSRLAWTARPAWAGLHLVLRADCCTPQPVPLDARFGWQRMHLAFGDARSQWPPALLAGLGTPWNTIQLDGDFTLATQGLSVEWAEGRLSVAGRAELLAQRVSSRLSTLRPMGSYRITVSGGNVPTLQLETLEGSPLELAGSGQWVGSRLRFSGTASAAPGREEALSNLLNIIGRRSGARSIISIG